MTRKRCYYLSIIAFALVAIGAGKSGMKFTALAQKATEIKSKRIEEEISKSKNHPWAGNYYAGDGLGVNTTLKIAPKEGFAFEWHGCLGVYDRNVGSVKEESGHLKLDFAYVNEQEGFQGLAEDLVPIRWGERQYLIPAKEMVDFCNAINSGGEPRDRLHGRYMLRLGDESKPTPGTPELPPQYAVYLLKKPIAGEIREVLKSTTRPSRADFKFKDTKVILNVGTNNGVRVGMEFFVVSGSTGVESLKVSSVTATSAEGVMTQIGEQEPGPNVGWRVSTKPRWREGRE